MGGYLTEGELEHYIRVAINDTLQNRIDDHNIEEEIKSIISRERYFLRYGKYKEDECQ